MNKTLLTQIQKNLYDIETSVESAKEDFEKYGIDVERFLRIIKIYISNFDLLKESKEEQLLTLLDEKLKTILASYEHLRLYHIKIKSSIHFIEKHKDTFFIKIVDKNSKEEIIKPTFLDSIKIKNYFSLIDIEIQNLKDKREIYFVGENGDGKTILLQAILLALKKEYSGYVIEYIRNNPNSPMQLSAKVEGFIDYSNNLDIKNVFAYGINRNKTADSNAKFDKYGYGGLFDTNDYRETTLLKDPFSVLGREYQGDNKLIKEFIKKLNKTILMEDLNIFNGGYIAFNELSEGYKSTIIWLYDLVSRLIENEPKVRKLADLKAIVLIDEVDLYLHPKWKYDFVHSLREVFPNIQFIMVTHSIVTVLGASDKAVFYKVYKEDGNTKISQQINDISHYTANILITSPLFNLDSITVRDFEDERLSSDDYIYHEIHKSMREYMQENPSSLDDEVKNELQKRLAEFRNR